MSTTRKCPNCGEPVVKHPDNGCVLNSLMRVVRDRGDTSDRRVRDIHAKCDVDALWNRLGEIVDDLESGFYSD